MMPRLGEGGAPPALPIGTLLTLPFAGPLVGRIGPRMAILAGFVLYSIAASLPCRSLRRRTKASARTTACGKAAETSARKS